VRVKYEIDGKAYTFRTFTGRDLALVTGKLAVLPVGEGGSPAAQLTWKSNAIADNLLAICSRVPKITTDEPDEIPEGTLPVSEIGDAVYLELVQRLCKDSGYSAEAAAEARPTSGIVEG
jgi:hypothetical protein